MRSRLNSLKRRVQKDIRSTDEKDQLTALVIRIMFMTSERVGNESSAKNGHFGITQFKKKHITLNAGTIRLKYKGKSGVLHEKSFFDPTSYKILQRIMKYDGDDLFKTSDGFRIRPDRVNRYLKQFDAKSKDIRGFNANLKMVSRMKGVHVPEPKDRPKVFNENLRAVADQIGHTPATLRKHYLLPEIEDDFYCKGKISSIIKL